MFDSLDNNSFQITELDRNRLVSMEIGEKVKGECGLWEVMRYKNDFVILTPKLMTERDSVPEVIRYLQELIEKH